MSLSGSGRSVKDKTLKVFDATRLMVQLLEIGGLIVFFAGIGLDEILLMGAGAMLGWGATALAYHNFQKDMAKRTPDRRDAMSVPKLALYIAFTVASALTLMTLLSVVV